MVNFHLGKVVMAIKPGKDVVAGSNSVQAVVEMWDRNQLLLNVDNSIAAELKTNDVVLVDYNPMPGISPPVPRQEIVKVLRGKLGKDCWDLFKKYYDEKNRRKGGEGEQEPIPGISYSR